ncbi:MAG: GntR family transcriptional regulator [Firmicutes bacterium]|nr:GntR family transcriptional regulator [Bacillota bacterium]
MAGRSIEESNPLPLYHQLKELLRSQIEGGEFPVGARLPSEVEIAEEYKISRSTVRLAILDLVREGLLYRKQGKGTFVANPKITRGMPGVTSFTEDMKARGLKPGARVLKFEIAVPPQRVAVSLRLRDKEEAARIERQMLADDEPIAFHISYLPLSVWNAINIKPEDLNDQSLFWCLENRARIVLDEGLETIEVGIADAYVASILGIKKGSPVLLLEHLVSSVDGEPVEFATNFYRGDRYKYYIKHKRQRISFMRR